MIEKCLLFYQCIVGFERGFDDEGNEQWYYFLSLVINSMLIFIFRPELWKLFTVSAIIHFVTVCVYGYFELEDRNGWFSSCYYMIHIIIFFICYSFNWQWTYLTSAITILAVLLAPKSMGNNILMPWTIDVSWSADGLFFLNGNNNTLAVLFFHTVLFGSFVTVTLNLPVSLWIKLIIILICIGLHPIIDISMAKGMVLSQVSKNAFEKTIDHITCEKED